jgi:hypothetical protein
MGDRGGEKSRVFDGKRFTPPSLHALAQRLDGRPARSNAECSCTCGLASEMPPSIRLRSPFQSFKLDRFRPLETHCQ